jgi:hypothetical protein
LLTKPINKAAGDLSDPEFDRLHWSIAKMPSCRFSHRPPNDPDHMPRPNRDCSPPVRTANE